MKNFISAFILFILVACDSSNPSTNDSFPKDTDVSTQHYDSMMSDTETVNEFYIEIPEELEEYSEEKKRLKYPGANRPQIVYGDEDGAVTIGVSLNTAQVSQEELPMFVASTKQGLKQSLGVEWISDGFEEVNGVRFAVMRFWSPSPDGRVYNMLCASSYNNKLVMLTFNFLEEDYEEWYEEFEAVKETIGFDGDENV